LSCPSLQPVLKLLRVRPSCAHTVKVEVASRVVTVTGPRGSLTRNFKHVPVDMQFLEDGKKLQIEMWFGNRKQCSIVNTTRTHILNMILGVVKVRDALPCSRGRS
jgi:ribosomal protein L6P/L9E